jgi:hypothetical protein
LATTLLLPGGILLFARNLIGRLLVVMGRVVVIAMLYVPLHVRPITASAILYAPRSVAVVSISAMVLALAPSRKRWCQSSRREDTSGPEPAEPA